MNDRKSTLSDASGVQVPPGDVGNVTWRTAAQVGFEDEGCGMRGDQAGYEAVEHTADLAVRAWAPDLAGLIEQAGRGMLDLMLEAHPPAEDCVEILAEGADPEELLVDCLREILALWTVEGRLPVSVEVREVREVRNRTATCSVGVGEAGAAAQVQEIKAVTYHDLEVQRTEEGLEVTVVFDV